MCYSAESSIISFSIGSLSCSYLLKSKNNTNKHIGLFLLSVVSMQFLEFLMWIDQKCGFLNSFASRTTRLVLILQIYTIFLGGYLYNTLIIPKDILKLILIPLSIYTIIGGFSPYFDKRKWCSKPNKDKSLQWPYQNEIPNIITVLYFTIFTISPFLLKELWKGVLVFSLGCLSFYMNQYKNNATRNSRWCYYSALVPLVFIIIDYFNY